MILYLILVSIGVSVLWLYYALVLRRNTFFQLNRWYLSGGLIVCFLAPLVHDFMPVDLVKPSTVEQSDSVPYVRALVHVAEKVSMELKSTSAAVSHDHSWIVTTYLIICALMVARLVWSVFRIINLSAGKSFDLHDGIRVYQHDTITRPFSLWRNIHVPRSWKLNIPREVWLHEKAHIDQYHFLDILLLELACAFLWFNPVIYIYRRSVRLNLEYLADKGVIAEECDPVHYQTLLLSMALTKKETSPFTLNFSGPFKNRIEMMQKPNSKNWKKLALLGTLPLVGLLVAMSTREELKSTIAAAIAPVTSTGITDARPSGSPIKKEQLIKVSSGYGMTIHPEQNEKVLHTGIDLMARLGTPVYATADGTVEMARFDPEKGYFIKLDHSGQYQTQYFHLKSFTVMEGAVVTKGQPIGYVGNTGQSTGPHLHYEVHENGKAVDPRGFMDIEDGC